MTNSSSHWLNPGGALPPVVVIGHLPVSQTGAKVATTGDLVEWNDTVRRFYRPFP